MAIWNALAAGFQNSDRVSTLSVGPYSLIHCTVFPLLVDKDMVELCFLPWGMCVSKAYLAFSGVMYLYSPVHTPLSDLKENCRFYSLHHEK